MSKCPFCLKENHKEKYFCENCESYMGSEHPNGLPPSPSEKFKKWPSKFLPGEKKSIPKTPEYVRLYRGPKVKKSTAKWLAKKDAEAQKHIATT